MAAGSFFLFRGILKMRDMGILALFIFTAKRGAMKKWGALKNVAQLRTRSVFSHSCHIICVP